MRTDSGPSSEYFTNMRMVDIFLDFVPLGFCGSGRLEPQRDAFRRSPPLPTFSCPGRPKKLEHVSRMKILLEGPACQVRRLPLSWPSKEVGAGGNHGRRAALFSPPHPANRRLAGLSTARGEASNIIRLKCYHSAKKFPQFLKDRS